MSVPARELEIFLSSFKSDECVEHTVEKIHRQIMEMPDKQSSEFVKHLIEQAICSIYRPSCQKLVLGIIAKVFARLYQTGRNAFFSCMSSICKGMNSSVGHIRYQSALITLAWVENANELPDDFLADAILNRILDVTDASTEVCIEIITCLIEKFNWTPVQATQVMCHSLSATKSFKILGDILRIVPIDGKLRHNLINLIITSDDIEARQVYYETIGNRTSYSAWSKLDLEIIIFFTSFDQTVWKLGSPMFQLLSRWFEDENLGSTLMAFVNKLDICESNNRDTLTGSLTLWLRILSSDILRGMAKSLKYACIEKQASPLNGLLLLNLAAEAITERGLAMEGLITASFCRKLLRTLDVDNVSEENLKNLENSNHLRTGLVVKICGFCSDRLSSTDILSTLVEKYHSMDIFKWRNASDLMTVLWNKEANRSFAQVEKIYTDIARAHGLKNLDGNTQVFRLEQLMKNPNAHCKLIAIITEYLKISNRKLPSHLWGFFSLLLTTINRIEQPDIFQQIIRLSSFLSRIEPEMAAFHKLHLLDIAESVNSLLNEEVQISMLNELADYCIFEYQTTGKCDPHLLKSFESFLFKQRFAPIISNKYKQMAVCCMSLILRGFFISAQILVVLTIMFIRTKSLAEYQLHEKLKHFLISITRNLKRSIEQETSNAVLAICDAFLTRKIYIKSDEFDGIFRCSTEIYVSSLMHKAAKDTTVALITDVLNLLKRHRSQTERIELILDTTTKYLMKPLESANQSNVNELLLFIKSVGSGFCHKTIKALIINLHKKISNQSKPGENLQDGNSSFYDLQIPIQEETRPPTEEDRETIYMLDSEITIRSSPSILNDCVIIESSQSVDQIRENSLESETYNEITIIKSEESSGSSIISSHIIG